MDTTCRPGDGRPRAAHLLPAWMSRIPTPWAVAVWAPILLIDPVVHLGEDEHGWLGGLAAFAVLTVFTATIVTLHRGPEQRWRAEVLLGVHAVLTVAVALGYGPRWYPLFTLLAIGTGTVVRPRRAPLAVVATTVAAAGLVSLRDQSWAAAWTVALTAFLAGIGTYGLQQLLTTISELTRTREELALTAVSEERLRFSRDLHDLLGHTLSVVVVKAEAVRRLALRDPAAAAEHAGDIEVIGRNALTEVRQAVTGYRGPSLAVEVRQAHSALDSADIGLTVVGADRRLPSDVDSLFGWVVREGVTNVIRHSGAQRCTITVGGADGRLWLELTDDGRGGAATGGPDPAAGAPGGGLRGLRERVSAAGGRLQAGPYDTGYRVAVDVPDPGPAPTTTSTTAAAVTPTVPTVPTAATVPAPPATTETR